MRHIVSLASVEHLVSVVSWLSIEYFQIDVWKLIDWLCQLGSISSHLTPQFIDTTHSFFWFPFPVCLTCSILLFNRYRNSLSSTIAKGISCLLDCIVKPFNISFVAFVYSVSERRICLKNLRDHRSQQHTFRLESRLVLLSKLIIKLVKFLVA